MRVGDEAPDFELADESGRRVRLSTLRGRWVVLYFYPADESPFCTTEACAFRDRHAELQKAGAVVLGVSRDDAATHVRFKRAHRLPFALLTDPDGAVLKDYDAVGLFGHPKRITYVLDAEGRVADVYESHVRPKNHVDRALEAVRAGARTARASPAGR